MLQIIKKMNNKLNIIPESPELVFIALNPTQEAVDNNAVFSRDEGFWNLLISACIIRESIKKVKLKERAKEAFQEQKHSNIRIGFTDLLPVIETDSKKVIVPPEAASFLIETAPNLKYAKRIALLGQKVVNSFSKDYAGLKSWEVIKRESNQNRFGEIGEIRIEDNIIEIYAMPFPINNNIKNKEVYYSKLIQNIK